LAYAGNNTPYEMELTRKINEYRQTKNLPPLYLSSTLNQLASEHSIYMDRQKQLNHDFFKQRVQSSGRNTCVENVGWNYPTSDKQFMGWYKSPGHHKNMINPAITVTGVARHGAYVTFFACR
jgi:uncharacterized protein YkwD